MRVEGCGLRVAPAPSTFAFRLDGVGVEGLGFRVEGLGLRVEG